MAFCRIFAKCAGIKALSALARLEYPRTREMCAAALATLCTLNDTHTRFLQDGGFKTMNELCQLNRFDLGTKCCWTIRHYCLICAIDAARRPGSRYQAIKDGALEMIVPIVKSSKTVETDEFCCRCVELYAQDICSKFQRLGDSPKMGLSVLPRRIENPCKIAWDREANRS